jgi:hypothetical protein
MSKGERGHESGHTAGSAEHPSHTVDPRIQVADRGALATRVSAEQTQPDGDDPAYTLRKPAGWDQMRLAIRPDNFLPDQQTKGEVVTEVLSGEVAVERQRAAHVLRTGMLL